LSPRARAAFVWRHVQDRDVGVAEQVPDSALARFAGWRQDAALARVRGREGEPAVRPIERRLPTKFVTTGRLAVNHIVAEPGEEASAH